MGSRLSFIMVVELYAELYTGLLFTMTVLLLKTGTSSLFEYSGKQAGSRRQCARSQGSH